MLVSIMLHIAVLGINNKAIFEVSENKEQGGSSLMIELSNSEVQKLPSTMLRKHKNSVEHDTVINHVKVGNEIVKDEKIIEKNQAVSTRNVTLIDRIRRDEIKRPSLDNVMLADKKIVFKDKNKKKDRNMKLNSSVDNEKIKTLLDKALSKHFYYPKSARRKNRQGKVILAFTINSNGLIEHVRVDMSSGYTVLDEAAIKAFKKIEMNEFLANVLLGTTTEYTLPISYRLN